MTRLYCKRAILHHRCRNNSQRRNALDQTNLNTLLSIVAIAIATTSLVFSAIRTHNDIRRMRRKPLIFETHTLPVKDQPDWHELNILVRNLEPVRANISLAKISGKARILTHDAASEGNVSGGRQTMNPLPLDAAQSTAQINQSVGSSTSVRSEHGFGGPEMRVYLYVYRWRGSKTLSFDWQWRDK